MTTWSYPVTLVASGAGMSGVSYTQALYIPAGRSIWGAAALAANDTVAGWSYSQVRYIPAGRSIWGAATVAAQSLVGGVLWNTRFGYVPGLFRTAPFYYWGN